MYFLKINKWKNKLIKDVWSCIVKDGKHWGNKVEYTSLQWDITNLNMLICVVLILLEMFSFQN